MHKAAAYGDFEVLKRLADANPQLLHEPDEQGYYAVQWAALNNRVAVLSYLLDCGCDVNAADNTGQTALHWSAVRGSTTALETLLREGANIAATDSRCGTAPRAAGAALGVGHGRQLAQWLQLASQRSRPRWRAMPPSRLPLDPNQRRHTTRSCAHPPCNAGATRRATWRRSTARPRRCITWR